MISAHPRHCDVGVQELFQTGRKSGWTGKRIMSLSSHPLRPGGHGSAPTSHTEHGVQATHKLGLSDRKSLYLQQVQRPLFASTPIKAVLAASHHMLPLLNSWDAELLEAPVRSHFQSVPPQRKRSLTPSSPQTSQKSSQCCHFYRQSSVRLNTHERLMWIRMCVGAGFLL